MVGASMSALLLTSLVGAAPSEAVLWYAQPAARWEEALPVGNGRLGGMVFGGAEQERVQFNEQTLWLGDEEAMGSYQPFGDLYLDQPAAAQPTGYRRELSLETAIARTRFVASGVTYTRECLDLP